MGKLGNRKDVIPYNFYIVTQINTHNHIFMCVYIYKYILLGFCVYIIIYLSLYWIFIALCRLSLVAVQFISVQLLSPV